MSVEEFGVYVLENIGRATLANALKIADRLGDGDKKYPVCDFCDSVSKSALEFLNKGRMESVVAYKIIVTCSDCKMEIECANARSKQMIIDDLIIRIWESVNGN